MSQKGGRPKRGEERATTLVRAYKDIGEMLKWVCLVRGKASAQLLDPVLRPFLCTLYAANYETILNLAESRGEADQLPVIPGVNAPLPGDRPAPPAGAGEPAEGEADDDKPKVKADAKEKKGKRKG